MSVVRGREIVPLSPILSVLTKGCCSTTISALFFEVEGNSDCNDNDVTTTSN